MRAIGGCVNLFSQRVETSTVTDPVPSDKVAAADYFPKSDKSLPGTQFEARFHYS